MWAQCPAVAPDPRRWPPVAAIVNGKSVMVPPKPGTFGTMGRNIFRDSGFKNVDFSVFKNFTFKERYNAQFRVEFFNMFNHPIIANPVRRIERLRRCLRQEPTIWGHPDVRLRVRHARRGRRQSADWFGKQPRNATRDEVHVLILF